MDKSVKISEKIYWKAKVKSAEKEMTLKDYIGNVIEKENENT